VVVWLVCVCTTQAGDAAGGRRSSDYKTTMRQHRNQVLGVKRMASNRPPLVALAQIAPFAAGAQHGGLSGLGARVNPRFSHASHTVVVAFPAFRWRSCSKSARYYLSLLRENAKATAHRVAVGLCLVRKAGDWHVGQWLAIAMRHPACPAPCQCLVVAACDDPAVVRCWFDATSNLALGLHLAFVPLWWVVLAEERWANLSVMPPNDIHSSGCSKSLLTGNDSSLCLSI